MVCKDRTTETPVHNSKAICNKGFSGFSSVVARSNFGVDSQESSPQSLTAYSRQPLAAIKRNKIRFGVKWEGKIKGC